MHYREQAFEHGHGPLAELGRLDDPADSHRIECRLITHVDRRMCDRCQARLELRHDALRLRQPGLHRNLMLREHPSGEIWIARQQHLTNLLKWQVQGSETAYDRSVRQLVGSVHAVASKPIDLGGHQNARLVIGPQGLDGQECGPREHPNR